MPFAMPVPNAPHSSAADLKEWVIVNYQNVTNGMPANAYQLILDEYATDLLKIGAWETAALIYTESQYLCPTDRSAKWLSAPGVVPATSVFKYELTYAPHLMAELGELVYWTQWCKWYGARFPTEIYTRGLHWIPRMFA
jgi:hypothetical protein